MTRSRDGFSDHHTFSQRHGYEPLPRPMQLEEISEDLRREIFNAVRVLFLRTKNSFGYFVNGYTSDEQGIRHALIDQATADVGLDEAMFMFGACASFAAYLANKHRQAQRQGPDGQ